LLRYSKSVAQKACHTFASTTQVGLIQALGLTTDMPEIPTPIAMLLATLVSGFLLLHVHGKNARRTATAKYRAALLEVFDGLYPIPSNWPGNIDSHLRQIFPSVQRAVKEFRQYVPWYRRRSYDSAWFAYRLGTDGREIDEQLYHQYMGFTSPGELVVDPNETFRINVGKLLRFSGEA